MIKDLEKGKILQHFTDGPNIVTRVIIGERECQESQTGRKRRRQTDRWQCYSAGFEMGRGPRID